MFFFPAIPPVCHFGRAGFEPCSVLRLLVLCSRSLKLHKKTMKWQRSDEDEEDDDSSTEPAGRRMLPPTISYKSPSLDSSPTTTSKSPATMEYIDIHRQILSLRRGSRASRGSSGGMIEMVEDALGGAVVNVGPVLPNGSGGGGMDARYRKWQTRAYNFLERPRGSKAIAYHVVV